MKWWDWKGLVGDEVILEMFEGLGIGFVLV